MRKSANGIAQYQRTVLVSLMYIKTTNTEPSKKMAAVSVYHLAAFLEKRELTVSADRVWSPSRL